MQGSMASQWSLQSTNLQPTQMLSCKRSSPLPLKQVQHPPEMSAFSRQAMCSNEVHLSDIEAQMGPALMA